jgi:hypothetical protein
VLPILLKSGCGSKREMKESISVLTVARPSVEEGGQGVREVVARQQLIGLQDAVQLVGPVQVQRHPHPHVLGALGRFPILAQQVALDHGLGPKVVQPVAARVIDGSLQSVAEPLQSASSFVIRSYSALSQRSGGPRSSANSRGFAGVLLCRLEMTMRAARMLYSGWQVFRVSATSAVRTSISLVKSSPQRLLIEENEPCR